MAAETTTASPNDSPSSPQPPDCSGMGEDFAGGSRSSGEGGNSVKEVETKSVPAAAAGVPIPELVSLSQHDSLLNLVASDAAKAKLIKLKSLPYHNEETQHKVNTAFLKILQLEMNGFIVIVDSSDSTIRYVSRSVVRFITLPKDGDAASSLVNSPVFRLLHSADHALFKNVLNILSSTSSTVNFQCRFVSQVDSLPPSDQQPQTNWADCSDTNCLSASCVALATSSKLSPQSESEPCILTCVSFAHDSYDKAPTAAAAATNFVSPLAPPSSQGAQSMSVLPPHPPPISSKSPGVCSKTWSPSSSQQVVHIRLTFPGTTQHSDGFATIHDPDVVLHSTVLSAAAPLSHNDPPSVSTFSIDAIQQHSVFSNYLSHQDKASFLSLLKQTYESGNSAASKDFSWTYLFNKSDEQQFRFSGKLKFDSPLTKQVILDAFISVGRNVLNKKSVGSPSNNLFSKFAAAASSEDVYSIDNLDSPPVGMLEQPGNPACPLMINTGGGYNDSSYALPTSPFKCGGGKYPEKAAHHSPKPNDSRQINESPSSALPENSPQESPTSTTDPERNLPPNLSENITAIRIKRMKIKQDMLLKECLKESAKNQQPPLLEMMLKYPSPSTPSSARNEGCPLGNTMPSYPTMPSTFTLSPNRSSLESASDPSTGRIQEACPLLLDHMCQTNSAAAQARISSRSGAGSVVIKDEPGLDEEEEQRTARGNAIIRSLLPSPSRGSSRSFSGEYTPMPPMSHPMSLTAAEMSRRECQLDNHSSPKRRKPAPLVLDGSGLTEVSSELSSKKRQKSMTSCKVGRPKKAQIQLSSSETELDSRRRRFSADSTSEPKQAKQVREDAPETPVANNDTSAGNNQPQTGGNNRPPGWFQQETTSVSDTLFDKDDDDFLGFDDLLGANNSPAEFPADFFSDDQQGPEYYLDSPSAFDPSSGSSSSEKKPVSCGSSTATTETATTGTSYPPVCKTPSGSSHNATSSRQVGIATPMNRNNDQTYPKKPPDCNTVAASVGGAGGMVPSVTTAAAAAVTPGASNFSPKEALHMMLKNKQATCRNSGENGLKPMCDPNIIGQRTLQNLLESPIEPDTTEMDDRSLPLMTQYPQQQRASPYLNRMIPPPSGNSLQQLQAMQTAQASSETGHPVSGYDPGMRPASLGPQMMNASPSGNMNSSAGYIQSTHPATPQPSPVFQQLNELQQINQSQSMSNLSNQNLSSLANQQTGGISSQPQRMNHIQMQLMNAPGSNSGMMVNPDNQHMISPVNHQDQNMMMSPGYMYQNGYMKQVPPRHMMRSLQFPSKPPQQMMQPNGGGMMPSGGMMMNSSTAQDISGQQGVMYQMPGNMMSMRMGGGVQTSSGANMGSYPVPANTPMGYPGAQASPQMVPMSQMQAMHGMMSPGNGQQGMMQPSPNQQRTMIGQFNSVRSPAAGMAIQNMPPPPSEGNSPVAAPYQRIKETHEIYNEMKSLVDPNCNSGAAGFSSANPQQMSQKTMMSHNSQQMYHHQQQMSSGSVQNSMGGISQTSYQVTQFKNVSQTGMMNVQMPPQHQQNSPGGGGGMTQRQQQMLQNPQMCSPQGLLAPAVPMPSSMAGSNGGNMTFPVYRQMPGIGFKDPVNPPNQIVTNIGESRMSGNQVPNNNSGGGGKVFLPSYMMSEQMQGLGNRPNSINYSPQQMPPANQNGGGNVHPGGSSNSFPPSQSQQNFNPSNPHMNSPRASAQFGHSLDQNFNPAPPQSYIQSTSGMRNITDAARQTTLSEEEEKDFLTFQSINEKIRAQSDAQSSSDVLSASSDRATGSNPTQSYAGDLNPSPSRNSCDISNDESKMLDEFSELLGSRSDSRMSESNAGLPQSSYSSSYSDQTSSNYQSQSEQRSNSQTEGFNSLQSLNSLGSNSASPFNQQGGELTSPNQYSGSMSFVQQPNQQMSQQQQFQNKPAAAASGILKSLLSNGGPPM